MNYGRRLGCLPPPRPSLTPTTPCMSAVALVENQDSLGSSDSGCVVSVEEPIFCLGRRLPGACPAPLPLGT